MNATSAIVLLDALLDSDMQSSAIYWCEQVMTMRGLIPITLAINKVDCASTSPEPHIASGLRRLCKLYPIKKLIRASIKTKLNVQFLV